MTGKVASVDKKLCMSCMKKPVYIKKRGLCLACYRQARLLENFEPHSLNSVSANPCKLTIKKHENLNELLFVKSFFKHTNWHPQPCTFSLPSGTSYRPDFYDGNRNVFIEVAGTRQAYEINKHKYVEFVEAYPLMQFEIRKKNGDLINIEDKRINWATSEDEQEQVAA